MDGVRGLMLGVALLTVLLVSGVVLGQALEPWSKKAQPGDVPKKHVQDVTQGDQKYTIVQGGTMDGENCRGPMGCGMAHEGTLEQVWESNRSVRMENVGDTDLVNPWLSNGRNNYRTIQEIVAHAVLPGMTDGEKAKAIWFQEINHRYHFGGGENSELGDPVKVFNIYGYNTCGNDSGCLASLWKTAGMKVTPAHAMGHCVSHAYYDGAYHFFDGDMHSIFLLRDNQTVACEQDIARDHDLVKRTHNLGITYAESRSTDEREAAMYFYELPPVGDRGMIYKTNMNMTLRPGEAIVWRWGHETPTKIRATRISYPDTICNGLWEYRPDFSNDLWKKGAQTVENVKSTPTGLAAADGATGTIIWDIKAPYILLGGKLQVEGNDAKFSLMRNDGKKTWQDAGADLDALLSPKDPTVYGYQLKCELTGDARLKSLKIVNDIQMAPLMLPAMKVGSNEFTYTDQTTGARKVQITHEWVERSASKPPAAPTGAETPANGGETDGTQVVFKWTPAVDPDGDAIADYQFILSERPDVAYPLSMDFYKLIGRTPDKGKAQYNLPAPGLLAPGTKYYWRVRAMDSKGVWGPWSPIWSFTARGVNYPVELKLDYDAEKGTGTLKWQANPVGTKPAKYRIYGSDEKGFSASDEPYKVLLGASKDLKSPFPANFIAETTATELVVLGTAAPENANKTYYRVVAVDAKGLRSGPSDYATAPRPIIYSAPVTAARVGQDYRYQLTATRSIGDLQDHTEGKDVVAKFWDVETPRFKLEQAPEWLKIDEATGLLSGTPDGPGKFEVTVSASIDRQVRKLDEPTWKWGNEKIVSTGTEHVGDATQKFTITVAP